MTILRKIAAYFATPTTAERTQLVLADFTEGFNRVMHPDHAIYVGQDADGLAHYTNIAL